MRLSGSRTSANRRLEENAGGGRRAALLGSAALLVGVCGAAVAHAEAAPPEAPATAGRSVQVEEVIVTARLRSENIQETPSSIGAIDPGRMKAMGVDSVVDLGSKIPGLIFATTAARPQPFTAIRGVGDYSRNPGFNNRVGVYLDGVLMGRSNTIDYPVFDIERVEVLRGPQGTLFGKDSLSGVISITTVKPSFDDGAKVILSAGSRNYLSATGFVNAVVGDNLAVRVSLLGQRQDGYYLNRFDNSHPGGYLNYASRVQVRWAPTSSTTVDLAIDAASSRQDLLANGQPLAAPAALPATFNRDYLKFPDYVVNWGISTSSERQIYGASATVEQELSAGFKGVSISAYREATSATRGLGTALAPYDFGGSNTFQKDYDISQEFRLLSPESRRFNYLIGAFYYKSSPSATTRLFRGSEYFPTTFRGAYSQRTSLVHDELWAVYGNATFRPIDQIAINGGLRYNYNRKDVYFVQDPAGLAGQGYANVPRYTDKLHEASLSPLVSVTFTPVEDINIYALYSTGKRPGGWNVDLVTTSQLQATRGSLEFDSESVKNYEAGVKMFLFDHRLRLNISAYHERFTNFQVTQFNSIPLPGGGLVSASQISNAALATSKGVEVDFDAAVTAGLHFTGGVGFNHAYFNSFPNAFQISAGPPPVFGAYTGNTLIEAPRFQGSLTSTYKWQLNSKIDGNASLSYTYRSRTYSDPSNGPDFTQKGFATVAARLAFANTSGEELAFFARNLFDAKYIEARGRSGAAVPFITYNQPRTLGIELTLRN